MSFTIGSLFSGIGGLELGLSWGLGGAEALWQAEMDPFASAVLARHWPEATRFSDVRLINGQSVPGVDLICGGFPCQPHSVAGRRESSNDERDLWGEFARIIGDVRPRWVVAENVPGLLSSADPAHGRGPGGFFGRVLRDLAEMGFDAEWGCFPAASVGAHHKRDRVFLVAYACGGWGQDDELRTGRQESGGNSTRPGALAYANSPERRPRPEGRHERHGHDAGRQEAAGGFAARGADEGHRDVAHANGERQPQPQGLQPDERGRTGDGGRETSADVAHASSAGRQEQHAPALAARAGQHTGGRDAPDWAGGHWGQPSPLAGNAQSRVRGVADGLPPRVAALRTLGNAVVPQQAAVIGRAIQDAEHCRRLTGALPDRIIRPEHFGGVA